jgi:hypothetical protein
VKVRFKQGAQIKTKPTVVYRELERIRKENDGVLSMAEIVRQSRPKGAPLHNEFEWNNSKAAEKYRQEQARYISRSIEIVRPETPTVQTRVYESTVIPGASEEDPPKRVFKRVEDILADPVARDDLLKGAIRDAISFRRRYHALQELSKVSRAIDEFLEKAV